MKKFAITSKGSLTQYIQENAIKAKNEIDNSLSISALGGNSCFDVRIVGVPKGLSVSL